MKQTLSNYEKNNFIQNLLQNISFPFMVADIEKVIALYRLGTISNGYRAGAITFPFIDINNNVRAIQVKQFNEANHTTATDFLHSIIEKHHSRNNTPLPNWLEAYQKNEKKVSCLFGEHLLNKYPYNPIALVEAPKTAIYGTLYFGFPEQPENLLWLAVYNLSSLNLDKCQALKNRNVYLFPDLSKNGNAFELWSNKAKELQKKIPNSRFIVSDLLENNATQIDKEKGLDFADYLIKQDWRLFRAKPEPTKNIISKKDIKSEAPKTKRCSNKNEIPPKVEIEPEPIEIIDWSEDIIKLENLFSKRRIPEQPIQLNKCTLIKDVSLFVENHLAAIKTNNGNPAFLPYLNRLQQLHSIICKLQPL